MNKQFKTFVWKLYISDFLGLFSFIAPFVAIMLSDSGLSAFQIAIVVMVSKIVHFSFEIPSGVIADKYNRKNVLVAVQLLSFCGFLTMMLFPHFIGFLIAYVFFGLAPSLASGCSAAFVYDELVYFKKRDCFERVCKERLWL